MRKLCSRNDTELTNPCLPAIVTVLPDTKNRPTVAL